MPGLFASREEDERAFDGTAGRVPGVARISLASSQGLKISHGYMFRYTSLLWVCDHVVKSDGCGALLTVSSSCGARKQGEFAC